MKSLKIKITMQLIFITTIILISITSVLVFFNYKNTVSALDKTMKETAKITALQIDTKLGTIRAILSEIGSTATLSSDITTVDEKKQILDSKRDAHKLNNISIAFSDGIDLNGNDIKNTDFFKAAINGNTYVADPIVSADAKSAQFVVSAPLWDKGYANTQVVGVVYAFVDSQYLFNIIDNIKVGETGSAFINDATSTLIAHKNKELVFIKSNAIKSSEKDPSLNDLISLLKKAMNGETAFASYTFGGVARFAAVSPIANTNGWIVGINVNSDEFMQETYDSIKLAIITCIFCLVLISIFSILLSHSITKPIREIGAASQSLANGDLNVHIEYKSKNELGRLSDSFNSTIFSLNNYIKDISYACKEISKGNFDIKLHEDFKGSFNEIAVSIDIIIENLSNTINQLSEMSSQVNSGATQVSASAQNLAQGAIDQAGATQELSATVNDITEHIKTNSINTQLANQKANIAGVQLKDSNSYMIELKTAMNEISSKSGEIGKIVKTIEDIAFQTNILALNAAVEAARAGAAGKGFAVVADEVRNLASKSSEAAKNTTVLINDTLLSIKTGTHIAEQTAEALNQSVSATKEAVELMNEIASVTKYQSEAVIQISLGLSQISSVVQVNSATAEQSAATSEELNGQSHELQNLVSKFKTSNRFDEQD